MNLYWQPKTANHSGKKHRDCNVKATLNKSLRMGAPWFGMGCKAQTAAMARICNAADRPKQGCARRKGLVQRCLNNDDNDDDRRHQKLARIRHIHHLQRSLVPYGSAGHVPSTSRGLRIKASNCPPRGCCGHRSWPMWRDQSSSCLSPFSFYRYIERLCLHVTRASSTFWLIIEDLSVATISFEEIPPKE